MMRNLFYSYLIAAALLFTGCSALLPSVKQTTQSPWRSFDDAKVSFDKIVVYKTTAIQLQELGFNPFLTPNIRILTYLDIMNRFLPNPSIRKEELDKGIQECIEAKANCKAYEFEPKIIKTKRHGNFWLDFLNFKRNTKESGWKFEALIVLVDDLVVYKLWGGRPMIDEERETKNPLGPFQNADDLLKELRESL